MPPSEEPVVVLRDVRRTYGRGPSAVHALRGVSLGLHAGALTAVMGPSGSGKSTLLQCAAGLDRPTSGSVLLGDTDLTRLREGRLTALRRTRLGFVFQSLNLLPALTVRQNVLLPLRLGGGRGDSGRADTLLARVGLAGRENSRPSELSGGQQQRVAIARALITNPEVIFADEPTGALDSANAAAVLALLRSSVDDLNTIVVVVTHDPAVTAWADRVITMNDGHITADRTTTPHGPRDDLAAVPDRSDDGGASVPRGLHDDLAAVPDLTGGAGATVPHGPGDDRASVPDLSDVDPADGGRVSVPCGACGGAAAGRGTCTR